MVQLRDRIAVSVVKLIIFVCVIQIFIRYSDGHNEPRRHLRCYFCRSDTHRTCNIEIEHHRREFVKNCTNETFAAFVEDLKNNPPDRPVIEITKMERKAMESPAEDWVCYTQLSQDETFTLRSCTPKPYDNVDDCHPCNQDGQPARCCTCSEDLCNDMHNGGWLISTRNDGTLYLLGLLTLLKFLR